MAVRSLKTNALLGGIKQICAIVFPLITFPYVSRVLGNDGFGKYSFSYSIISYFILIAALGVSTYSIREGAKIRDNKEQITKFASQVFSINVFSVIVSYILLAFTIIISQKIRSYAPYLLIQSVSMILAAVGTDWINSIYEDFLYITVRYIVMQVLSLILMFVFVRSSSDVVAYCIISVIASGGGNLFNILYVRKYVKFRFTLNCDIKKHLPALLILFVNSVAITIYVNSDITMLGFFSNDEVVGVYSFASKIYNILKQLIHAIIVVAVPRIAYILQNSPDQYRKNVDKIFQALMVILLPIAAGLVGTGDSIILIAGGSEYISGTASLRILSGAMIFAIVAALFTNCVLIVNKLEKRCLKATIVSALINVILNFFLLPYIGIEGAAITTLIAELVNCVLQIYFSKEIIKLSELSWNTVIPCVIGSVLILLVCWGCNHYIQQLFIKFIAAVIISALVYAMTLIIMKHPMASEIICFAQKKLKKGKA